MPYFFPDDLTSFFRILEPNMSPMDKIEFDKLERDLGIQSGDVEAWYKVSNKSAIGFGGAALLAKHRNSLIRLLATFRPDVAWEPLKFGRVPRNYWDSKENQRTFLDDLAGQLGVDSGNREGWYTVSTAKLRTFGGGGLLKLHKGSLYSLLKTVYPEFNWDPVKFAKTPQRYWASLTNQRDFMDSVGRSLGFKEGNLAAWYNISNQTFIENGGKSLLNRFGSSLSALLAHVYPDFPWEVSKFIRAPLHHWAPLENQLNFVRELGEKLGISDGESLDKWYAITNRMVREKGGGSLLQQYKGSLSALLASVYPQHQWDPSRFSKVPHRHWVSLENQRKHMLSIRDDLGIKAGDWEAWYSVPTSLVIEKGGGSVLKLYQGSLPQLLARVFPEYNWNPWKFLRRTGRLKEDPAHLDNVLLQLEQALGITAPQEWRRVNVEQLPLNEAVKDLNLRLNSGDLVEALQRRYPEERWGYPLKNQGTTNANKSALT